jgi:predicted HNH restriction endonuclease
MITGTRDSSRRMIYRFVGTYTPSGIRDDPSDRGLHIVYGEECTPLQPPLVLNDLDWFQELLRAQNNFSFGFNPIRSERIITELRRLFEQHDRESVLQPEQVAFPSQFFEGATRQVSTNRYERNPCARQQCIEQYGCRCSVCNFDFEQVYGELGRGFIHVHHLKSLSEIGEEYQIDPIADLRPVCANCHAMIHHGTDLTSIDDLRERIQSNITSS